MSGSSEAGTRRYRISALLGKGSSGRIYRAVLEDSGQETDVAVKLLRDEDVEALTLPRLREEARLMGLVRDKALVRVEPPVRLTASDAKISDRWALVMDLVTGVSLQRLTSQGALPPSVVCELVGEVARVLDKVWQAPGPDGRPLRILHRDLKPSNLQINSAGKLWVLDFGIVKADYKTRDGQTTAYATGTRGFIAPERLEGQGSDAPAGDVFSLGVTAQSLMEVDSSAFGQLITQMQSPHPDDRPTAKDVEEQCARLRRRMEGMTLREWAERYVSKAIAVRFSDEFVGKVLTETAPPAARVRGKTPDPGRVNRPSATPMMSGVFGTDPPPNETPPTAKPTSKPSATSGVKDARGFPKKGKGKSDDDETVVLPSDAYMAMLEDDEPSGRSGAQRAQPGRDPGASLEASLNGLPPRVPQSRTGQQRLPPGLADAATEVDSQSASVRKVQTGGWMLGLAAMGMVAVVVLMFSTFLGAAGMWWLWPDNHSGSARSELDEPRMRLPQQPQLSSAAARGSEGAGGEQRLTFSSIPLGVDVYIDRKPVGQTPVVGVMVPAGQHELTLVSDSEQLVRKIDVGKKKPIRYVWKGGETWETHY